jgi:hypothetical protein
MAYLAVKYLVTALVIVIASEVAKKTGKLGALITALPLVAIMAMIWLHVEHQGNRKISAYAGYTFWYVLPTLPMFVLMPWLLSRAFNFWLALLACAALTAVCFVLTTLIARIFGVNLIP